MKLHRESYLSLVRIPRCHALLEWQKMQFHFQFTLPMKLLLGGHKRPRCTLQAEWQHLMLAHSLQKCLLTTTDSILARSHWFRYPIWEFGNILPLRLTLYIANSCIGKQNVTGRFLFQETAMYSKGHDFITICCLYKWFYGFVRIYDYCFTSSYYPARSGETWSNFFPQPMQRKFIFFSSVSHSHLTHSAIRKPIGGQHIFREWARAHLRRQLPRAGAHFKWRICWVV